jgi:hypothetical protein
MNESWICPKCGKESDDSFDFHLDKEDDLTRLYTCAGCKTEWNAVWTLKEKTFNENTYEVKVTEDGISARCFNEDQFVSFVKATGFKNVSQFMSDTGVFFADLKGKWFQLVHNRIYIEE